MNILQVVSYFPPAYAFGGPAKVVHLISKELVKRGHNVTVYTTDAMSPTKRLNVPRIANVDGIQVHYMRNVSQIPIRMSNLFICPELFRASKLEVETFDIIHLHEFTTFQNVVVSGYAKKYCVPYILQGHGTIPIIGRKARKLVFNTLFGRKLLMGATKAIALSPSEELDFKAAGYPSDKIVVIPNGIDLSEYEYLPERGCFRKKFAIDDKDRVILYLGRIHKIKGIDILGKSFFHCSRQAG